MHICYVYILNIFIYNINYMNINICMLIHVNIFKIYTVRVCLYIYIINIHSTHTYILYRQKLLFWMRLIVAQHYKMFSAKLKWSKTLRLNKLVNCGTKAKLSN